MVEIVNFTKDRIGKKYFQKIGKIVLGKLEQPRDAEVSLVFVGDARMKALNKKYRGKNKTTDVLSFAYGDVKIPPSPPFLKGGENLLGEIVISVPQARLQCLARRQDCRQAVGLAKHGGQAKKQAKKRSYPLKSELTMLFVHGILHLAGYNDETEKDYRKMIKKQEEILESLI